MTARCLCGNGFEARTKRQRFCASCVELHRRGRRCESLVPCARCDAAFARLAEYNRRRKEEGADNDRRRGAAIKCPCGCGASYAGFRSGFRFVDARRDFITDEPNVKTGRRRHGRRNGVLGKLRELKLLAWNAMAAEHVAAKGAA